MMVTEIRRKKGPARVNPRTSESGQAFEARAPICAGFLTPPFPKDGRIHLVDFPTEKIVIARPRVDLARANLTAETAGMLVGVLLPCRDVRQPAAGAAKIFGRP